MLKEGDEFDGLKLLKLCGTGGFGSVFYCEDFSGKKRAVKIISKVQIGASWQRELKGVRIYQKITDNAPGLLQIYHVKDKDEYFYYTMESADPVSSSELYTPDTLAFRLQQKPLPEKKLFPVLSKVFQDLKVIHANGCAHRDIKPENILFAKKEPLLADFGLGGPFSRKVHSGTAGYFPPWNPASGKERDLYALGKILYALFSGKDPSEYPLLPENSLLPGEILSFFNSLVYRACGRPGEKRFANVGDFGKELREGEEIFFPPGKK
jgi:serine/threonine-protein kinase